MRESKWCEDIRGADPARLIAQAEFKSRVKASRLPRPTRTLADNDCFFLENIIFNCSAINLGNIELFNVIKLTRSEHVKITIKGHRVYIRTSFARVVGIICSLLSKLHITLNEFKFYLDFISSFGDLNFKNVGSQTFGFIILV